MAIVGTDQEDDENKIVQPTSSSSANAHAGQQGGGGGFVGGAGSGQGATTGAAPGQAPAAGGGGYANLSQYLSANQSTGGTTGQAAENVVQQSGDTAKQAQSTYNTGATKDIADASAPLGVSKDTLSTIKSGAANVDQGTLDKISAGGYTYKADQTGLDKISGAKGAGAVDSSILDKFIADGKAATGAYTGPTDFSKVGYGGPSAEKVNVNYGGPTTTDAFTGQTAQNQANAVQQAGVVSGNVKNAQGGQSGVSALLKNAYQQPNYTAGENSLDAFLAGGTAGGQEALGKAAGVGSDVDSSYAGINTALTGKIGDAQKLAGATNETYKGAIDDATKISANTQDTYNKAVQGAQTTALADQKVAQDAASKAQTEKDREAQWLKDHPPIVAPSETQSPTTLNTIKATGRNISAETKKVTDPIVSDSKNLRNNVVNSPSSIGRDVNGAVSGNQKSLNNVATTIATGGANKITPQTTANTIATAKKLATPILKPVAKVAEPVTQVAQKLADPVAQPMQRLSNAIGSHHFHFAHGGEVPSYAKILDILRRK